MKITHENYDQLTVMRLAGELNGDTRDVFERAVKERLEADGIRDFVLDFEPLETIDSTGYEALLWLQERCSEQLGQIRLACAAEHVREALRLTRLSSRLDCHDEIDDAIRSLRG